MSQSRTVVLVALLVGLLVLASLLLGAVFGTVFFAGTVAYLLIPVVRRVERLGLSRWLASAATAVVVSLAALVPLALGLYVASGRVSQFVDAIGDLPEAFPVAAFGYEYVVDVGVVIDATVTYAAAFAVDVASALPVLGLKFTLFGVLVFGLLLAHQDAERAFLATIPEEYHDLAHALGQRATATLYAIYVLQAVTAVVTTLIAIPVFLAFGVPFAVTLAVLAGVLQFVPIVGPSMVVAGVAIYWASIGDTTGAIAIIAVAGVLVAWLPDVLVRPRLSRETANLPGSLYFIGFTGGLLTVGPVGIIAGPLVVALVVETASMLAEAHNGTVQTRLDDTENPDRDAPEPSSEPVDSANPDDSPNSDDSADADESPAPNDSPDPDATTESGAPADAPSKDPDSSA